MRSCKNALNTINPLCSITTAAPCNCRCHCHSVSVPPCDRVTVASSQSLIMSRSIYRIHTYRKCKATRNLANGNIFGTLQLEKNVSLFSTTSALDSIKKGVGYSGMVPFARPEVALHFHCGGCILPCNQTISTNEWTSLCAPLKQRSRTVKAYKKVFDCFVKFRPSV